MLCPTGRVVVLVRVVVMLADGGLVPIGDTVLKLGPRAVMSDRAGGGGGGVSIDKLISRVSEVNTVNLSDASDDGLSTLHSADCDTSDT